MNCAFVEDLPIKGHGCVGRLEVGELDVANTILVLANRLKVSQHGKLLLTSISTPLKKARMSLSETPGQLEILTITDSEWSPEGLRERLWDLLIAKVVEFIIY